MGNLMASERRVIRRGHPFLLSAAVFLTITITLCYLQLDFGITLVMYILMSALIYGWFFNGVGAWQKKLLLTGAHTEGTVTQSSIRKDLIPAGEFRRRGLPYYCIGVTYSVDGQTYHETAKIYYPLLMNAFNKPKGTQGDKVTIYFDREKPKHFIIYEACAWKVI